MKNSQQICTAAVLLLVRRTGAFQPIHKVSRFPGASDASTFSKVRITSSRGSTARKLSSTQLFSSANAPTESEVDADALVKYAVAAAVQMGGFFLLLNGMDLAVSALDLTPPLWANCLFFYACSLKSRVLNPLSNERPKVASPIEQDIKRPSWMPPGVIFPIMWLLIIGPIRAYSSALVCDEAGCYASLATLSFLLHLSIGDVWNTVNNVEQRLGAAASGVNFVFFSAANASYQYYQVDSTAGELLGLTLLWLGTAGALVNSIWQLNPDGETGVVDALYPIKSDVETKYAWFSKAE